MTEPLSEMPVRKELLIDVTLEDASMDMKPPYDPSQLAFLTLLHSTPLIPTVEPSLGTNDVTWHSNGGADGRFHHPVPFSNHDNIYLSSPLVLPSLPPSPWTTADDASSQDLPFMYSSPFFKGVSWLLCCSPPGSLLGPCHDTTYYIDCWPLHICSTLSNY